MPPAPTLILTPPAELQDVHSYFEKEDSEEAMKYVMGASDRSEELST